MTAPRDQNLDASCLDDDRHEAHFGFGLNVSEDGRIGELGGLHFLLPTDAEDDGDYITELDFPEEFPEDANE